MTVVFDYDVVVVGAGPAGLIYADTISAALPRMSILVVEQGAPADERSCPSEGQLRCSGCEVCSIACGVGGAGLHSDGKLVLASKSGGFLSEVVPDTGSRDSLVARVESLLFALDGDSVKLAPEEEAVRTLRSRLEPSGLAFKPYTVRHMGSENLRRVVRRLSERVASRQAVTIRTRTRVVHAEQAGLGWRVILLDQLGRTHTASCKKLVVAVGKAGQQFVEGLTAQLSLDTTPNTAYLGFRLVAPQSVLKPLFEASLDPKVSRDYPGITRVKTHCGCRHGEVIPVRYEASTLVGGHTRYTERNPQSNRRIDVSNINVLAAMPSAAAARRAIAAFRQDPLLIETQSMASLLERPQPVAQAVGAIDRLFSENPRILECVVDFVRRLDSSLPGAGGNQSIGYVPACEWLAPRLRLNGDLSTQASGLYVIGDGAGTSQGVVQAGAMALVAADELIANESELADARAPQPAVL